MRLCFTILSIIFLSTSFGQGEWTLEQCIDSAMANNNGIRLSELDLGISEVNMRATNLNYMPSVNANATHGYNWGQTIDPFTNQFAANRVQYNNFYLSSSLTLFSGLTNHYSRKIETIDYRISGENLKRKKRSITLDIITAYLQVKLNSELVKLREKHISYIKETIERDIILEELDYQTKKDRLESEAQKSKEEYQMILALNDLRKASFLLQTLIGITPDSTFQLSDSISLEMSFNIDENLLQTLNTKRILYENKQLKGRLLPTISINGSLGSGYSENNKFLTPNGELAPKPFDDQLSENFYQSLSATISIPIFSGANSYSQIKINQLEYQQQLIRNEQHSIRRKNQLLEYHLDIENQKAALESARKSFDAYTKLYEDSKIQFENGVIDYYTFIQVKDDFFNAESELVQSKYRLLFAEFIYMVYL
ncbi:TolC family protein [Crocinitomix algicola]|uniref:TolC family protein n=1 Tax=Crocinitomix algicola TaxID=1740263 RepID=UPI000834DD6D|nr:TolC family protein [Crocinitomix algicola]